MNEEAILDSYNLFIGEGYNGSIEDYKTLLNTNPDALKDSYGLFQSGGYSDSQEDFEILLGVKKKATSESISTDQELGPTSASVGKSTPLDTGGVPKRDGVRINPDGTESTHLMSAEVLEDGTWVGFPRLFQDEDGTWVDMTEGNWEEAYQEALKRGEVKEFGTDKEKAIAYGEGSWKINENQKLEASSDLEAIETNEENKLVDLETAKKSGIPTKENLRLINEAEALSKLEPPEYKGDYVRNLEEIIVLDNKQRDLEKHYSGDINLLNGDIDYIEASRKKDQLIEKNKEYDGFFQQLTEDTGSNQGGIGTVLHRLTAGQFENAEETVKISNGVKGEVLKIIGGDQQLLDQISQGFLPLDKKEELISNAKINHLKSEVKRIELEAKIFSQDPDNSTTDKKEKAIELTDEFNTILGTIGYDVTKNKLADTFKKTTKSKEFQEMFSGKGIWNNIADDLFTATGGLGGVILDATLGFVGDSAAMIGNLVTDSEDEKFTIFDAYSSALKGVTEFEFAPNSQAKRKQLLDSEGNLNINLETISKSFSNTIPFTAYLISQARKGNISGIEKQLGRFLNPVKNEITSRNLNMVESAYRATISDNLSLAKELGLDNADASIYAVTTSSLEGILQLILPDYLLLNPNAYKLALETFKGDLKKAVTKKATTAAVKKFGEGVLLENVEEESIFALTELTTAALVVGNESSEFWDWSRHKELIAATTIMTVPLSGTGAIRTTKNQRRILYQNINNDITNIINTLDTKLEDPNLTQEDRDNIYKVKIYAHNISNAVQKSPKDVTSDQIEFLIEKDKLLVERESLDASFRSGIDEKIAELDVKIKDSKVEEIEESEEEVIEEVKTEEEVVDNNVVVPGSRTVDIKMDESGKAVVVDKKTGKPLEKAPPVKVQKYILENVIDVNEGEKATIGEGATPDQLYSEIADTSNNIKEVAEAIELVEADGKTSIEGDFEGLINQRSGTSAIKFTPESWKAVTGLTPEESDIQSKTKSSVWIAEKEDGGVSLEDGYASLLARNKELPGDVTERITASDVAEFIAKYPTVTAIKEASSSIELNNLKQRFEDLTGLKATPTNIKTVTNINPVEARESLSSIKQKIKDQEGRPGPEPVNEAIDVSDKKSILDLRNRLTDNTKKNIVKQANRASVALKSVFPNMTMTIHETQTSFDRAMEASDNVYLEGRNGNFTYDTDAGTGEIHINLAEANNNTVPHEVGHAVLLAKFGDANQSLYDGFRNKIENLIDRETNKDLKEFVESYEGSEMSEEYITELIATLANTNEKISLNILQTIAEFINKLSSKIGIVPFKKVRDTKEIIDFIQKTAKSIATGSDVNIEQDIDSKVVDKPKTTKKSSKKNTKAPVEKEVSGFNIKKLFSGMPVFSYLDDVFYRNISSKLDAVVAKMVTESIDSKYKYKRIIGQTATNWFNGLPRTVKELARSRRLKGEQDVAAVEGARLTRQLQDIIRSNPESASRVHAALDPEIYDDASIAYEDLTENEQFLYDELIDLNAQTHELNYKEGFIDKETYDKFKGKYIARLYEEFEDPDIIKAKGWFNRALKNQITPDIYKERKAVDQWKIDNKVQDPIYLTINRMIKTARNVAVKTYAEEISKTKAVKKEKEGYVLMEGKRYGSLSGMYVPHYISEDFQGYSFTNEITDQLYNALKSYDRLQARQVLKKSHTVWNPVVQLGNLLSNFAFAFVTGANAVQVSMNFSKARKAIKMQNKVYQILVKNGIIGSDVLTNDLRTSKGDIAGSLDKSTTTEAKTIWQKLTAPFIKADKYATNAYGASDDVMKVSTYISLRDAGYSETEAIEKVFDGMQNYATVGKVWDAAAKTPVFGNAYIKFQADLMRITKNAVVKRPLTTASFLGALKALSLVASALSGEDDDKREVREERGYIPKIRLSYIGLSDIPLVFKVGNKEINLARFISPYYTYHIPNEGLVSEITGFMPYSFESIEGKEMGADHISPEAPDVLLGGLIQAFFQNRDFRNKAISDPYATRYKESGLSETDKVMNKVIYVGRSTIPAASSIQDMYLSATTGEDYYGRTKSIGDVIMSQVIKIQTFENPEYAKAINSTYKNLQYEGKNIEAKKKSVWSHYKSEAERYGKKVSNGKMSAAQANKNMVKAYDKAIKNSNDYLTDLVKVQDKINAFSIKVSKINFKKK